MRTPLMTYTIKRTRKPTLSINWEIVLTVLAIFILALFVFHLTKSEQKEEVARYNDGVCIECHRGHLEQRGTYFDRADGTTFNRFVCDNCGEQFLFQYIGNEKK